MRQVVPGVSPTAPVMAAENAASVNPAVPMGGVVGARSHSGSCREAAVEIQSNVPWIGFPVAYALSGILLTTFTSSCFSRNKCGGGA